MIKAKIHIMLKDGVLDPQGSAVKKALANLEYRGIAEVRFGKYLEITLEGNELSRAGSEVNRMCREFLANPVLENYAYELEVIE